MKYIYILVCTCLLVANSVFSQSNIESFDKESFSNRFLYGGGIGISFGTVTQIELTPQIEYRVTDRFNVGTGFIYRYMSVNDYYSMSFRTSIYGYKLFSNYMITNQIFPHVELESLNLEKKYFDFIHNFPDEGRYWYQSIFIGGGYFMPIGNRGGSYIIVLYNINDSPNSPYSSPWVFKAGFSF